MRKVSSETAKLHVRGSSVFQAEGKPGKDKEIGISKAGRGSWKQFCVAGVWDGLSGWELKPEVHRPYEGAGV